MSFWLQCKIDYIIIVLCEFKYNLNSAFADCMALTSVSTTPQINT